MKRSKLNKEKYKTLNLGRKGTPESLMASIPVLKEIKILKKKTEAK